MLPEGPNNKSLGSASRAAEVRCPLPVTLWLPGVPALLMDPAVLETRADGHLFLAGVGLPPGLRVGNLFIARAWGGHLGGHRFGLHY